MQMQFLMAQLSGTKAALALSAKENAVAAQQVQWLSSGILKRQGVYRSR